jgi:hypothetical protein
LIAAWSVSDWLLIQLQVRQITRLAGTSESFSAIDIPQGPSLKEKTSEGFIPWRLFSWQEPT